MDWRAFRLHGCGLNNLLSRARFKLAALAQKAVRVDKMAYAASFRKG
jgi:hypothetical protein